MDGGRKVKLVQETRYPWDGAVRITVSPDEPGRFAINVRIPGWARGEARAERPLPLRGRVRARRSTLRVNGQAVPVALEKGYARIDRSWKAGDVIELGAADAGPPRRRQSLASTPTRAAWRCSAVRSSTPPSGRTTRAARCATCCCPTTPRSPPSSDPDLLNGVQVVNGRAVALANDADGKVSQQEQDFTAIPYYAWANRGPGEMAGLDPQPRDERAAPAAADPGLPGERDVLAGGTQPAGGQRPGRAASRPATAPAPSSTGGPRRAARSGSTTTFDAAEPRLRGRGLLARRHGQRRVPRAGVLARPLQGRRGVEAGRGRRDPTASRRTRTTRSTFTPVTTTACASR